MFLERLHKSKWFWRAGWSFYGSVAILQIWHDRKEIADKMLADMAKMSKVSTLHPLYSYSLLAFLLFFFVGIVIYPPPRTESDAKANGRRANTASGSQDDAATNS